MVRLVERVVPAGAMAGRAQPELYIEDDLTLRPWRHDDADIAIAAFAVPDIQHWHCRRLDTTDEAIEWIDACNQAWTEETAATWAIVDRSDARLAGRVTIYTDLAAGHGEVAYWVLPHARGRGCATRACIAATRWAHELGVQRIRLEHSVHNPASRRVAVAAGYSEEGVCRQAVLHADGWHDMVQYSHLATDPLPAPGHDDAG